MDLKEGILLYQPLFKLDNISFAYPSGETVFKNLGMEIYAGEKVCLLGANGSGKSSLLKILCGLIYPSQGHLVSNNQPVTEKSMEDDHFAKNYHRRVGFIFQNSDVQLFTTRVWEEIAYGPLQMGLTRQEVETRVTDVMTMLNITDLSERSPHRLSGGEKKKVAVASVLALNPEALILDEPTAGLDPKTERWLIELLLELNRRGRTIIVSTHNLDLAHIISNRALVLSQAHELVYDGPTYEALENRELLMEVNLIDEFCHIHGENQHIHRYSHG